MTEYVKERSKVATGTHLEQLERYRLLVDSLKDYAIFLLEPDGSIASWNEGAKRLKGYTEDEILGKHFSIFYTRDDLDHKIPEQALASAKKDGRVELEGWRVRKDGSRFWADVIITALYDDNKKLVGFAKVTRDLSDRKAMEDELAKANDDLRQQQKILTMLNEAKDEFISLASHQLRTPATGVKQYLNLIIEGFLGEVPDTVLNAVKKANDSNERQIELVNDLLQVAQLDAGKIVLLRQKEDIAQLIKDVVAEQHDTISARNQEVTLSEAANTETDAYVDKQRIRMVFENIIDNATKYTPADGSIKVSIYNEDSHIVVAVKDTGVGIKASDLPLLFTKFSRIQNELSDRVGGSGLGLYWANRVVELHGGTIQVASKLHQGTEFKVLLPKG